MKKHCKSFAFALALIMLVLSTNISGAFCTAYAIENDKNEPDVSAESEIEYSSEYLSINEAFSVLNYQNLQDVTFKWYIDGNKIENDNSSYTPQKSDLGKFIKVETYSSNILIAEKSLYFSTLPVIYINTLEGAAIDSKETYTSSNLKIQGNDEYNSQTTTLYDGECSVKGHGNSTWLRFDKKAYKLKLDKKTNLFGLGKNKHWLLIANYIDETNIRQSTANEIAEIYGAEHLDALHVDVVLNGQYNGLYLFSQQTRISKERVNIFDWEDEASSIAKAVAKKDGLSDEMKDELGDFLEENLQWMSDGCFYFHGKRYVVSNYYKVNTNINGGYLFEIDNGIYEEPTLYTKRNVSMQVKRPEAASSSVGVMNAIYSFIQEFEDAICSDDKYIQKGNEKISYLDLCDFQSLLSYVLTNEILISEAGGRSTYFYKDIDDVIKFGPIWDFDWSSDSVNPFDAIDHESWSIASKDWFAQIAKDPYFAIKLRELYLENLQKLASIIQSGGFIDQLSKKIETSALINESKWLYSRGFKGDLNALKRFIQNRIDWLNKQFASDETIVKSLGSTPSSEIEIEASGDVSKINNVIYAKSGVEFSATLPQGAEKADIFVNGRFFNSFDAENSKVTFRLEKDELDEKQGSANVIVVKTETSAGRIFNFASVKIVDELPQINKLYFVKDNTITNTISVASGEYVYLFKNEKEDEIFAGWTGRQFFKNGSLLKVDGNLSLSENYQSCIDGANKHTFENGYEVCIKCGQQKSVSKLKTVTSLDYVLSNKYKQTYTGSGIEPDVQVYDNGVLLEKGKDYRISFINNVNAGFATYTVRGIEKKGYKGEVSLSFKIVSCAISSASAEYEASCVFESKPVTPSVKLTYNGIELIENKDYTLQYENNDAIGTGYITLTGMGNFSGSKKYAFSILPPAVSSLKVTQSSYNSTALSWKVSKFASAYAIYCKASTDSSYSRIATIDDNTVGSFQHNNLKTGTKYYYKIRAYSSVNGKNYYSAYTSAVAITPVLPKPSASPILSKVNANDGIYAKIQLSQLDGASGYQIYRSSSKNGTYKKIATQSGLTFTDKSSKAGQTYYYKYRAYTVVNSKNVYSAFSAVKGIKLAFDTPKAPNAIKATSGSNMYAKLTLTKVSGASGYQIYRSSSKNGTYKKIVTQSGLSYTDKSSKIGQTYYYKYRAYTVVDSKNVYSAFSAVKGIKLK